MHLHTLFLVLTLTANKPTPAPPVVAAPPAAARDELATSEMLVLHGLYQQAEERLILLINEPGLDAGRKARALMLLGDAAAGLKQPGLAIYDWNEAKKLDPTQASVVDQRVQELGGVVLTPEKLQKNQELRTRLALYERFAAPSPEDKEFVEWVDRGAAAQEQLELALKIPDLTPQEKLTILNLKFQNRLMRFDDCTAAFLETRERMRAAYRTPNNNEGTDHRWCIAALEPIVASMVALDPKATSTLENELQLAAVFGQSSKTKDKLREVLKAVVAADPTGFLGDVAARRLKLVR